MKKSNSVLKLNFSENFRNKINSEKEIIKNNISNNNLSLVKHKIFLEKILQLIKISQVDFLSHISFNSKQIKKNTNNKKIKDLLIHLKNDLINTLKNNSENKAKIQNIMNNNKSFLIKSIFDFEGENNNNLKIKKNEGGIKKIKEINNDNNYKYNIELPHLKLLNFKIENQLQYMNIMIKLKIENIKNFKNENPKFIDAYIYIFCSHKNELLEASNYLHDDLINIRNAFKLIVKKKEIQNMNLIDLNSQVISMREKVALKGKKSSNDYINTSDIINEESKEYYTKTNFNTFENYKNVKK